MPSPIQLLCSGESSGAGTNHRDPLARSHQWRFGANPIFAEGMLDDGFLDHLDGDRRFVDSQDAGGFARRGTNTTGEFRKIVGGMQHTDSFAPAVAIDQIVPIRNHVVQWAAGMAERNAAIHAARALRANLVLGKFLIDLEPVVHAFDDRTARRSFSRVFQETGCFTHAPPRDVAGLGVGGSGLARQPAQFPALVCIRAGTLLRISGAFRASVPVSICRAGWLSIPHAWRSGRERFVGLDRKWVPGRHSIYCRARSRTLRS